MEFRTAREYDTSDLFFGDNCLFDDEEDKFIVGPDAGSRRQSGTRDIIGGDGSSPRHVSTAAACRCCCVREVPDHG